MIAPRQGGSAHHPPRSEQVDVAIVGGGIAGLAAAFEIRRRAARAPSQVRVTVFEARPVIGGKVRTERVDGLTIEQAPDSFLVRKPEARQFCVDLGLEQQLVGINPAARGTAILHRGRLVPMPESMVLVAPTRLRPFMTTPLLSVAGKLRAALDLVLPTGVAQDDESIEDFVRRRFGQEIATRLAVPLLGGVYGGGSGDISLEATFPELRRLEWKHRSVLVGLRSLDRQRRGRPILPMFETLRGGLQSMVEAIESQLPAGSMRTGRPVARLELLPEHAGKRYRLRMADGGSFEAHAVILATPAPAAAGLLEPLAPGAARLLNDIAYSPSLLVALAFPAGAIGARLYGTGFLAPAAARPHVAACTYVHRKWPHTTPRGQVLLRCFVGGDLDEALRWDDHTLTAAVRAELDPLLDIRGEHHLARVFRWQRGTPRYAPGHLARVQQVEALVASLPGLALAGASYRGLGLPDCIRQGQTAARMVLDQLGVPST